MHPSTDHATNVHSASETVVGVITAKPISVSSVVHIYGTNRSNRKGALMPHCNDVLMRFPFTVRVDLIALRGPIASSRMKKRPSAPFMRALMETGLDAIEM